MNRRAWWWVGAGMLMLALLWLASYALRTPTVESPTPAAPSESAARRSRPQREVFLGEPATESAPSFHAGAVTNAADVYRRAFALYEALSKDEKGLLGDWRTNVDVTVTAELCEKIRPICEALHEASAITNCDWGIENPFRPATLLPHLAPARALARTGAWSATHCRERLGAVEDLASIVRLGRQVDSAALIGSLVDIAIESVALSCVASNLTLFAGDGRQLIDLLTQPVAEELPSRAMRMEAGFAAQIGVDLATKTPEEAAKYLVELFTPFGDGEPPKFDVATALAEIKKVVELERELAEVLASSSTDRFEEWLQRFNALKTSSPIPQALLPACDSFVQRVQAAVVNRALVVAALSITMEGSSALATHPDPSTGQPFTFQKIPGGFELQSAYQVNDKPLKIFFPMH